MPTQTSGISQGMPKFSPQIVAKAMGPPSEPDGTGATSAMPADLTELSLKELMDLLVTGHARFDSIMPAVEALLQNNDLPEDLTQLALAELMNLAVHAGRRPELLEDLTNLDLADLTNLDLADLMTIPVHAGRIEIPDDENDESELNQIATLSSGVQSTDLYLDPLVDELSSGSTSDDELVTGDSLGSSPGGSDTLDPSPDQNGSAVNDAPVAPLSATAVGASLTPVTVMVTVAVSLPPMPSDMG